MSAVMARASAHPLFGVTLAVLAAVLSAMNGVVSKVALDAGLTPGMLTLLRMGGTALLAGAVLLATDRSGFRLTRRDLLLTVVLGVVGLSLANWFYATAFALVDVGMVILIAFTSVVVVAVIGRLFLGEAASRWLWPAIAFVLAGLAVVTNAAGGGAGIDPVGVLLALGAMGCYATYFLVARGVAQTRSPVSLVFWSCTWGTAFWLVASSWWTFDAGILLAHVDLGGGLAGIALPLLVLVCYTFSMGAFVPNMLSYKGLQSLSATSGGILASTEVVWSFLLAWVWLGQALSGLQVAGVLVVIAGVVLAQIAATPRRPEPPLLV